MKRIEQEELGSEGEEDDCKDSPKWRRPERM